MKALRAHRRGGPEQFSIEDAPMPHVGPEDVLVEVHAAGITFAEFDWDLSWTRLDGTDRTPVIPAHEFSGTILSTEGSDSGLQNGDAVLGLVPFHRDGAAAEYVSVPIANVVGKPHSLTHAESAAIPLAALTSWQALVEHARLEAGESILIHGAAGGVGSAAVQLAVALGANVTATARTADIDFVHSLGATHVIDVDAGPFDDGFAPTDVVLDTIGGETLRRSFGALRRGGRLVTLSAPPDQELADEAGVTAIFFVVESNRAQLAEIVRMTDNGALRPVVCQTFRLDDGRAAYESGRIRRRPGKTVLTVRP
jgi:NADPH:quinone reductase-like Zn-dependent oxidoreductase